MLVHTDFRKGVQTSVAARVEALWNQCAFNSHKGLTEVKNLWLADHCKVSAANGSELMPASFEELAPFLAEAVKRIERGTKVYMVINSESSDTPDFAAGPVWKIMVGGNKLSRGYTVEGLTVSYYRRVSGTGDTLMQMGRWFGFRPGYKDLVRVYLGVSEGRKGAVDLVSSFKEVCRMEERFRDDIRRYVRTPGSRPLTPKEIPPLIYLSGSLPPTAANKMFHATVSERNFGGRRIMPTMLPAEPENLSSNIDTLKQLLKSSHPVSTPQLGGERASGSKILFPAVARKAGNADIVGFLESFCWHEADYKAGSRPSEVNLQINFLKSMDHGVKTWLIIAPQRKSSFGDPLEVPQIGPLAVKERARVPGRGFEVIGEPAHRLVADFLAGIPPGNDAFTADKATRSCLGKHTAVMLLYPIREVQQGEVSVGFELFYPPNNIPFDSNLTVRKK
jgi:hypothetical protein